MPLTKHLFSAVTTGLLTLGAASAKPNIIFIMADDLGYADIGCYGNETIKTPHIDKLAAEGVKCTDYHSNGTVCSPTRAALMTGRYQQRSGINGVITAKSHRDVGLALKEWTMGEAMKEQGYATAMFGKWHLGYPAKFNPVHQGFDEFRGFVSGNVDYHHHVDQEGHFDWWEQDKLKDDPGYITDLITSYSIDFIKRKKQSNFCLIINHGAPHYPIQGRNDPGFRIAGQPGNKQPRQKLKNPKASFKEMIEVMDEGIGKIVDVLEELELRDNTLIIFCSDNGPGSSGSAGPYRGMKGQVFEGGHRVPGVFNWPGTLPAGKICTTPVLTMDMLPTFVAMAGGQVAAERKLDGIDVIEVLKGKEIKRPALFWSFGGRKAVRDGQWKLVVQNKQKMLFNLASDPSEKADLAKQHPEKVTELTKTIQAWEATFPTEAPASK